MFKIWKEEVVSWFEVNDQHCRRMRRRRRTATDTEGVVTGERFNHASTDCISTAAVCSAPLQSAVIRGRVPNWVAVLLAALEKLNRR